jgi:peptidoglycan/LPS O-acetylase OafA/YrhL
MQYRPDIDALRAVAVIPVILFHLGVSSIEGGYVGVDVFFVISGYLITSVILGKGEQFSILDFYKMRARRILPALFLVVLVTMLVAAFVMLPVDFKRLSQSAVAVALFSSNILFWIQSGYFDTASHLKPLLHTWSLGVEEQFYIVFPVVMLLLQRLRATKCVILSVLSVLAVLSFTLSVLFPGYERGDSFYLPHFRAWELLLGAVLALASPKVPRRPILRECLALTGCVLILVPVFVYTVETPFPGWNALYPCVGAALIIYANPEGAFLVGRILRNPIPVFVGKLSYSLYLWHWPVIVLYQYYKIGRVTGTEQIGLLVVIFLLSYLSWKYAETPVRRGGFSTRTIFAGSGAVSAAVIAIGFAGHVENGFPQRFARSMVQLEERDAYNPRTCFLEMKQTFGDWNPERCTFPAQGEERGPKVLLWGDSHAAHLVPGLLELQRETRFTLIEAAFAGCPPIVGYEENDNPNCRTFNDGIADFIKTERPDVVMLSARWNAFRDPYFLERILEETIEAVRRENVVPIVVGDSPSFAAPVPDIAFMLEQRGLPPDRYTPSDSFRADEAIERLSMRMGFAYFPTRSELCPDSSCLLSKDHSLLYWDQSHLTAFGSIYLLKNMTEFFHRHLPAGDVAEGGQSIIEKTNSRHRY